MIDRRILGDIDWILVALILLNSLLGLVVIYSSSHYLPGNIYLKQVLWIVLSIVALFLILIVDYKTLLSYSFYFYIIIIFILAGMLLFSRVIAGAKSWIRFPFFQVQPSELTKIIVILLLANFFSKFNKNSIRIKETVLSTAIVAVPLFLVASQPDLGTALSYIPIILGSFILAGITRKSFIILLIFAMVISFLGWNFCLRDYQKERLTTLITPSKDPLGSGYQILQSKIAIGSGGLIGKGYKKGTQSQLRFLPARHTDFIFSVIGEEFGYLGVVLVLFFYYLLLSRLFNSVSKARGRAGMYIIFMVAMMIAFQFFVNVMMVVGLFPITGIPLPFLSYGGSSLLSNYLAIGLVLNVKMRRFVNV